MTSGEIWTVLRVMQWSEGFLTRKEVASPKAEVDLLLAEALGVRRLDLYIQFERVLKPEELARFKALILRRASHEPTAYIMGRREFYGLEFAVDKRVLIPRPETEHLIDAALEHLPKGGSPRILEIGTGSGNIASVLATKRPDARIVTTEISADALAVACANFKKHGVAERIKALVGDMFAPLNAADIGSFDGIVSNPPYVAEEWRSKLAPEVRDFEPNGALFAGEDGLNAIRRIARESRRYLKAGGFVALEIGIGQSEETKELFTISGFSKFEIRRDYSSIERVIIAR